MKNIGNIHINKLSLLNGLLFFTSPFLAIPTIFIGIANKSKFALLLLVMLFGLVSYMYIPNVSNDRASYFELYENFSSASFLELFAYLMLQGQDFILQSMFYWASQFNLSAQYVFAFTTLVSMGLIFSVYYKITNKAESSSTNLRLFSILFLCLSIPYVDLLSGTRFVFAISFVLMAFYIGLIEKKKTAFLLLIIASFIHFSTLIFALVFLVLFFFPNQNRVYKILFLISILFVLVPPGVLLSLFNTFGFSGGLEVKANAYLEGDDFIKNALEESYLMRIGNFLELFWLFGVYIYIIFISKTTGVYRNIILFTATTINLFFAVPTIFFRYAIFLKLLFVFLLIGELYKYKNKIWMYWFATILVCLLFLQIISCLPNLIETFLNKEVLALFLIINEAPLSTNNFIQ